MEEYVLISKLINHPVFIENSQFLLKRIAVEFTVKFSIEGASDFSTRDYVDAVRNAISRNVSGIMITGWADKEVIPIINFAIKKEIPVVTVDCDIPESMRLAHVGTDWYRMGQAMAEMLAQMINGPGKVLLMGFSGLDNMEKGFRGFLQRIMLYPDIQLLGPENVFDINAEKTEAVLTKYLQLYPDLSGIVSFDCNSGLWVARTLKKLQKIKTVNFICVDGDKEHIDFLKSGILDAIFMQKREYFNYLAFQLLYGYNHGSVGTGYKPGKINIPGNIDTGYTLLLKDTVDTLHPVFDVDEATHRHHLSQKIMFFSQMLNNVREIVLATDPKGNIIYANPAANFQLQYERAFLENANISELFSFSETDFRLILKCANAEVCHNLRTQAKRKDASVFPVQVSISPLLGSESKVRGLILVAMDNTDEASDRQKLMESELKFRALFDNAASAIFIADAESGIIVECNITAEKLIGKSKKEIIGLHQTLIHPLEEKERYKKLFADHVKNLDSCALEAEVVHASGSKIPVMINSKITLIGGKRLNIVYFVDLREKRSIEKLLSKERDLARHILDISQVIILVLDLGGNITLVNKKGCDVLEAENREIIGKNWFENFLPAENREKVKQVFSCLVKKQIAVAEYYVNPIITKNGKIKVISWHNAFIEDADGKTISVVTSGTEITT
ncbi:MAG: PAS domain S-box protein [Candidatus Omnitrophica bacterium]|nr:PAS domain S-box protein [Candidatus Omnitrophota bacterium]